MEYWTGGLSFDFILAAFFFWLVGTAILKLLRLSNRKKNGGARGGEQFSFKFWVKDNWIGVALHLLIAILTIRFTSEVVHYFGVEFLESDDPMWVYAFIGLSMQTIIDGIQKLTR